MVVNIITQEDLQALRRELIEEIRTLLSQRQGLPPRKWLKSHEVQRLLSIAPSTLQHFRSHGLLPFSKIKGVIYYNIDDVEKMLQERRQNIGSTDKKNP